MSDRLPALLVLRPQPGADATVRRARAAGWQAMAAPIFTVAPLGWEPPAADEVDALLFTSANGVRHAGPALARFAHLPVLAVGEATARAARDAGFGRVTAGDGDATAILREAARAGHGRLLHLAGRSFRDAPAPAGVALMRRIVYSADPVAALPPAAAEALRREAITLIHSPRAAALFAGLLDGAALDRRNVRVAALSAAVAVAAGDGWRATAVARCPTDAALLEAAAALCDDARREETR